MYNFKLTDSGERIVDNFLFMLKLRRKEILESGTDTAVNTVVPSISDIIDDINSSFDPEFGHYSELWNVTDNHNMCLFLKEGVDIVQKEVKLLKVEMFVEVDEDYVGEIRNWEHHIDYAIDLDFYPEIKSISGVSVTEIEEVE